MCPVQRVTGDLRNQPCALAPRLLCAPLPTSASSVVSNGCCADFMDGVESVGELPSSSYRLGVRAAPLHRLFSGVAFRTCTLLLSEKSWNAAPVQI